MNTTSPDLANVSNKGVFKAPESLGFAPPFLQVLLYEEREKDLAFTRKNGKLEKRFLFVFLRFTHLHVITEEKK